MSRALNRMVWLGSVVAALGAASACSSDDPSPGTGSGGEPTQGEAGAGGTGVGGESSSSGGTSGSGGGTSGSGGEPAQGGQPDAAGASAGGEGGAPALKYSLIDDFEDRDYAFSGVERHFGAWFADVDSYKSEIELEISNQYCRLESEGCAILNGQTPTPGAGEYPWARFGGVFRSPTSSELQTHDVSAYSGITFWAQGEASIRFEVMMQSLLQAGAGGTCEPQQQDNCNNGHKLWLEITPEWRQYFVPFAELEQDPEWGEQVAFDPTEVIGFFLWFEEGTAFSAAFDDVAFY